MGHPNLVYTPTELLVKELLSRIGEDPEREGLKDTPRRVVKMWEEMLAGYKMKAEDFMVSFENPGCDEMITVRGIPYVSFCEHHWLPFTGEVTVSYIPNNKIIGLSKIGRVVDVFAKRLQVQERMTEQIATAIINGLKPNGVAVCVVGTHTCMSCRGVRKTGEMITTSLWGVFQENAATRNEFLSMFRS